MNPNESEYNKQIDENRDRNASLKIGYNQAELTNNDNSTNNNEHHISKNNVDMNNNNNSFINDTTEANIIENNNIINNNIIINNNSINIDNIQNINNQINDDSNNAQTLEEYYEPYNPNTTFSFNILFTLNTLAYIHSYYKTFELKKYTLCLWPIINKNQYYRLITSHFYHFGFIDYFIAMICLFFITRYLEREIGSIYCILITFYGMILISIIYIIIMWIFKYILRSEEYNLIAQCGFSSIDFCLYLSFFLLKKNYRRNINISYIELRGIHSAFFMILILQLITPSASIITNMAGAASSFIIFRYIKYFCLPRNYWICDMEKFFGLNKPYTNCKIKSFVGYFAVKENDTISNNIKELDYFFNNINKEKSIENYGKAKQ
jgi:membrane associated rhomboid family serine protease